jgi:hypothetical protein
LQLQDRRGKKAMINAGEEKGRKFERRGRKAMTETGEEKRGKS